MEPHAIKEMSEQTSTETWKPITGYEGTYSVSTLGSIRNDKTNRNLKPGVIKSAYCRVLLHKHGLGKNWLVHRLVALTFIPNPLNKKEVDHVDRNSLNNRVENLRWSTSSENHSNNTSKGCYLSKSTGRWRAIITHNLKRMHIGYYTTESEARDAYLAKAKELKGEFAQKE